MLYVYSIFVVQKREREQTIIYTYYHLFNTPKTLSLGMPMDRALQPPPICIREGSYLFLFPHIYFLQNRKTFWFSHFSFGLLVLKVIRSRKIKGEISNFVGLVGVIRIRYDTNCNLNGIVVVYLNTKQYLCCRRLVALYD